MLGYMTKTKAKELGFTHYGKMYGIPVYLTRHPNLPMISVKHPIMEYAMDLAEAIARSMQVVETELSYYGEL